MGDDPTGVTRTWNDGPPAGAGVQLNAQPMFHPAAVVVNAGLVQFPCICVGPMRTRAGPAAAVDDDEVDVVVDPPGAVVVVDPPEAVDVVDRPAADVVVDPPGAVVVVAPLEPVAVPVEVGNLYAGAFDALDDWGVPPNV